MSSATHLDLDGSSLSISDLLQVVRPPHREVSLAASVEKGMEASRSWVEQAARETEGKVNLPIYGCNTGFGINREIAIPRKDLIRLSRNLLLSHATGVGPDFPDEVVRGAMLLRANALAKGFSGCRPEVVNTLLEMLNKGVTPVVPIYGSVGGSGDLAPLSHMALVLSMDPEEATGKTGFFDSGRARLRGSNESLPGAAAMRRAGIRRVLLQEKEALALNNGTQFVTALSALAVADAGSVAGACAAAAGLTLEAVRGNGDCLSEKLNEARGFPGQVRVAAAIRDQLSGSTLIYDDAQDREKYVAHLESARTGKARGDYPKEGIHNAYSIRCTPQVLGASVDALAYVLTSVEREMNSANDNPLIFVDAQRENKSFSGGNFHGAPVAMAADFMKIALCEIGSISERRCALLLDSKFNRGLPDFLIEDRGLNSGLMVTQYMAAGLVAENKILAHPASVDTIPTGNGFEDHVSMGTHGARQAREILENVATIVAVELLAGFQALFLRQKLMKAQGETFRSGDGSQNVLQTIRNEDVEPYLIDRSPARDIRKIRQAILDGKFSSAQFIN